MLFGNQIGINMEERTCKYEKCNKTFKLAHSQSEYCSHECWEKEHGMYDETKKRVNNDKKNGRQG